MAPASVWASSCPCSRAGYIGCARAARTATSPTFAICRRSWPGWRPTCSKFGCNWRVGSRPKSGRRCRPAADRAAQRPQRLGLQQVPGRALSRHRLRPVRRRSTDIADGPAPHGRYTSCSARRSGARSDLDVERCRGRRARSPRTVKALVVWKSWPPLARPRPCSCCYDARAQSVCRRSRSASLFATLVACGCLRSGPRLVWSVLIVHWSSLEHGHRRCRRVCGWLRVPTRGRMRVVRRSAVARGYCRGASTLAPPPLGSDGQPARPTRQLLPDDHRALLS